MIKSMTGFGRFEMLENNRKFIVEIKSVNHRYLDINMRIPKKLNFVESSVRSLLKEYIQRGKVDLFISYEDYNEENFSVKYNEAAAATYLNYFNQMADSFCLENDITVNMLSRYPEVFTPEAPKIDEKQLWSTLEKTLRGACEQFVETRVIEGTNLQKDLLEKIEQMLLYVDFIEEHSPLILKEYKNKLEEKVREFLADKPLDDARIVTEVVLFADRICVDEEIVRLKSHMETTKKVLLDGAVIGRKLDFIVQEMNREANTILSKTSDIEISNVGIELKTEIEKVREQIQNIE